MYKIFFNETELQFETLPSLFSPKNADSGTLLMLENCIAEQNDKILDLGCGYGLVGIYYAKIYGNKNIHMSDIDPFAIDMAQENMRLNNLNNINFYVSNAFDNIDQTDFDIILSNPPYHADFNIAKSFIEKGFNRLKVGGKFYMVTKRLDWYKNKFISIFGGVKITEKDGYYVFMSQKKSKKYAEKNKK